MRREDVPVVWFARGGGVKRMGPFATQAQAARALVLTNDRGFPDDAFIWPEEVTAVDARKVKP